MDSEQDKPNSPDWAKVLAHLEPKKPLYCPHNPHPKQKAFLRSETLEALFGGAASGGKMLAVNTVINSTTGWTTIGNLKVGEFVYGEDGKPTEVLAKSEVETPKSYLVQMADGEEFEACAGHRWNVSDEKQRSRYQRTDPSWKAKRRANRALRGKSDQERIGASDGRARGTAEATSHNNSKRAQEARESAERPSIWDYTTTLTTEEIIELQRTERKRVSIPNAAPIQGEGDWKSDIPPYTFGAWLGDGGARDGYVYICENDRVATIRELELDGWSIETGSLSTPEMNPARNQNFYGLRLTASDGRTLVQILRAEGFHNNKYVPDWIVSAPYSDRLAFLGGFCDTDGYVDETRGRVEFCLAREDMVRDVHMLFWSIGQSPTKIVHKRTTNQTDEFEGDAWRFQISQCDATLFRMPRKRDRLLAVQSEQKMDRSKYRAIESITEIDPVPMQCIQVANDSGLFRIGRSFLTTHNSDALLMAALQYVDVPDYAAFIFRNTFADLALPGAIMDRARDWLNEYPEVRWLSKSNTAIFPSGATLSFGYLDGAEDYLRYKGMEVQYIGFDEVTEIREQHYRYLISRLRKPSVASGRALAHVPLRVRSASNPAPNWVRRYFVEEGKQKGRLFVPCGFEENPFVNQEAYGEALDRLSPVDRARLKLGDWYAEETGNFFNRSDFNISSPDEVPSTAFMNVVRYWDLAATEKSDLNPDPDWTVGAKVAIVDGYMFVLDIRRFRKNAAGVEMAVRQTAEEDGPNVKIRMDQDPGQAGKAQVSHYARHVLLGFDFDGNPVPKSNSANMTAKMSRVNNWLPKVKRGEVFLVRGDWVTDYLDEAVSFGSSTGIHDDQMDATSGGFEILTGIKGKQRRSVSIIV